MIQEQLFNQNMFSLCNFWFRMCKIKQCIKAVLQSFCKRKDQILRHRKMVAQASLLQKNFKLYLLRNAPLMRTKLHIVANYSEILKERQKHTIRMCLVSTVSTDTVEMRAKPILKDKFLTKMATMHELTTKIRIYFQQLQVIKDCFREGQLKECLRKA